MARGLAEMTNTGKEPTGKKEAAQIVAEMFSINTYSRMAHLATSSYSKHKALNEFYDEVVDMADDFAETAQGKFGKLEIPVVNVDTRVSEPDMVLEESIEKILKAASVCDNRALNAIVDEIEGLYRSTIYKLRELH